MSTSPPRPTAPRSARSRPKRRIDFRRYRKLRRFVLATLLQAFWHDLVLNHRTLRWARQPPLPRWQRITRRYRELALEMGGVLIKLGQFLSTRVDLLPREITSQLSDLLDTVPPVPFEEVVAVIEADFGRPADRVFTWVDAQPLGAASLAQVHRARLPDGSDAVVKVLRPRIDVLVETDLAALRLATRLLGRWKKLRQRVDLDLLYEEFANTTRNELDLQREGRNAERFAENFAGDRRIGSPEIYWQHSAARVLTMENVAHLKIADLDALDAAGVDRAEVAKQLFRCYMSQIFEHFFVHADPHPGNLFVRPLEPFFGAAGTAERDAAGDGDEAPPDDLGDSDEDEPRNEGEAAAAAPAFRGRPFQLVFVDFGMVTTVPPRLREAMLEYAIGLGTRDAARMVRAERAAGIILPGADLSRFEQIYEDVFERFWGVSVGDLRDTAFAEAKYFLSRYRDLLFEMPIQVRVEMLFVVRAIGLLAGLATSLDARFDPWSEAIPFARRLANRELRKSVPEWIEAIGRQGRIAALLPERIQRAASRIDRGDVGVEASLSRQAIERFERLEKAGRRLVWAVIGGALGVAGTVLWVSPAVSGAVEAAPWVMAAGGLACLRALWRRR